MIQGTLLGTIEFMIAPPGFLRGLDPRVQIGDAPGLFESMARIGATGVPMDFAEVVAALQSRTLDGARSSVVVMAPMKFFTVAKYLTTVNDTMIPVGCYVSKVWLDKLPADLRTAVVETSKIDENWTFEASVKANGHFLKVWRDGGGEVPQLPPADQAEFLKRVSAVADEVYGKDPVLGEMYRLYKQVAESHRKKYGDRPRGGRARNRAAAGEPANHTIDVACGKRI